MGNYTPSNRALSRDFAEDTLLLERRINMKDTIKFSWSEIPYGVLDL